MKTAIVIPARYGSSRFPGKPLADILGKPMIQHVYEKATQARCADTVVVATDDIRIADAVKDFGGVAVMTSPNHPSGTDRIIEVAQTVDADVYINVQGDEPLIRPEDIDLVSDAMTGHTNCPVATLCHPISAMEADNPNVVKVTKSHSGNALYFSRSPIPFGRDDRSHSMYFKHIGLYGYRKEALAEYQNLPASGLEGLEKLEQLRLLEADIPIKVLETTQTGPGVDTPACLEKVKKILSGECSIDTGEPTLKGIKLLITDVDGVLTNGQLEYAAEGETLKRFHARDGLGIKMLQHCGVCVAVASGRDSRPLRKRLDDLGVTIRVTGEGDKASACEKIMAKTRFSPEETAYIGDDTLDLPGFEACGVSFAVGDAPDYVKAKATFVLTAKGGNGAVREAVEMILCDKGIDSVFKTAEGFKAMLAKVSQ